jgi:hypothetical protein
MLREIKPDHLIACHRVETWLPEPDTLSAT